MLVNSATIFNNLMFCRGLRMQYFIEMNYLSERKVNIQLCSLFLLYKLQGLILRITFSNCQSYLLDHFFCH